MKRNEKIILLVLSASVILTSVGFSSFLVNQTYTGQFTYENQTKEAGVYNSATGTYYSSLEKAIEEANQSSGTVNLYLIAGTTYTLTESVTLNSNVILNLPYEEEEVFDYCDSSSTTQALKNSSTYLQTQLILAEGVTITNYGTINVGGIIGSAGGGSSPGGQTASYYSEILCSGVIDDYGNYTPQILNYGTIKNQGSIAGVSDDVIGVANFEGSELDTPMVVSENRGGSAFVALAGGYLQAAFGANFQSAPFNRMYFPNTSTKTITYHGASIVALVDLWANDENNTTEIKMFGSDSSSFIQSFENSYIVTQSNLIEEAVYYNSTVIESSYDQLDLDFYGDFNINYMELSLQLLSIMSVTISTDGLLFPISYSMDISFYSLDENTTNTVNSYQDIKVLPGGSLTIGKNVIFNCEDIAIYDEWTDTATLNRYPNVGVDEGYFELNGSLYVDNIGGYINSTYENASLVISESASISSKEVAGTPTDGEYETLTFTATGNIDNTDNSTFGVNSYLYDGSTWTLNEAEVTLNPSSYSFDSSGGSTTFTATISPSNATVENVSWSVSDTSAASISWDTSNPLTATLTANSNSSSSDVSFNVQFTASVNGVTLSATSTVTVERSSSGGGGGCILAGTEILMADGTTKLVDDIRAGDIVKAFNHWTGRLENCLVVLNAHYNEGKTKSDVLTLTFDNGVDIGIVYKHGFYSVEDRKYVDIDPYNYKDYISKKFAYVDQQTMKIEKATLVKGTVEAKVVKYYAPITKEHLNLVANSFINMPGSIICLQNIFDRDENMKIFEDKAKEDIDNYGLFTYETFEKFMSKAAFENFGVKYLKVSIGKGYMTWDDCFEIIAAYKEYLG